MSKVSGLEVGISEFRRESVNRNYLTADPKTRLPTKLTREQGNFGTRKTYHEQVTRARPSPGLQSIRPCRKNETLPEPAACSSLIGRQRPLTSPPYSRYVREISP